VLCLTGTERAETEDDDGDAAGLESAGTRRGRRRRTRGWRTRTRSLTCALSAARGGCRRCASETESPATDKTTRTETRPNVEVVEAVWPGHVEQLVRATRPRLGMQEKDGGVRACGRRPAGDEAGAGADHGGERTAYAGEGGELDVEQS
jgi:hypothetical protein